MLCHDCNHDCNVSQHNCPKLLALTAQQHCLFVATEEEVKGLRMRAANTIEKIQQNQDQYSSAGREECETFERLCVIQQILTAANG